MRKAILLQYFTTQTRVITAYGNDKIISFSYLCPLLKNILTLTLLLLNCRYYFYLNQLFQKAFSSFMVPLRTENFQGRVAGRLLVEK